MTDHSCPTGIALSLTVTCIPEDDDALQLKAQALAEKLHLRGASCGAQPQEAPSPCSPQYRLVYTVKGLELQTLGPETGRFTTTLTTDFVHGNTGYRRLHGGGIHQPLARATGLKAGVRPTIVDATAGLGIDAFILASLGCKVTMIERSPVIGALLADGLQRAASHPATKDIMSRLQLFIGNSHEIIASLPEQPATIYLDPMYPHRHTAALNKQEMRTIRSLVGDDQDAAALLETALTIASNRVVVKRPKGAPELSARRPSHIIEMKNSRFDVYLTNRLTRAKSPQPNNPYNMSHSFCIMQNIDKFQTIQKGAAHKETYRKVFRSGQEYNQRVRSYCLQRVYPSLDVSW
jgi:16S rRNA (guanine1516-N2)-methyltransferase